MKLASSSLKKNLLILTIARLSQLLVDSIVKLIIRKKSNRDKNLKKKLSIVDTGAIGDFVILTGMLPGLREIYPAQSWEIDLISSHQSQGIVKLLDLNILDTPSTYDSFIPIDTLAFTRNLIYRFRFQQQLIESHYDLVICPTFPRRLSDSQLLFIISSDRKIGIEKGYTCTDLSQLDLARERSIEYVTRDIFPSIELGEPPEKSARIAPPWISEVQKNAIILKYLGRSCKNEIVPKWSLPQTVAAESSALAKAYSISQPFALICPGAFDAYRVWSADKMSIVVDYLWTKYHLQAVICGSLAEKSRSDEIQSHLKVAKPICICGKTSLIELTGLIAAAKICIAMDSSPSHISIALGTPLVSVVGGGHYHRFLPYDDRDKFRVATEELDCFFCDWKCKFDRPICIENIPVQTVIFEIDSLLKKSNFN